MGNAPFTILFTRFDGFGRLYIQNGKRRNGVRNGYTPNYIRR